MFENFIGAIIFLIFGIVILCGSIFVTQSLVAGIIGGLFLGAGIFWVIQEVLDGKKKK